MAQSQPITVRRVSDGWLRVSGLDIDGDTLVSDIDSRSLVEQIGVALHMPPPAPVLDDHLFGPPDRL
jgi:hypothetical protein